MPLSKERLPNAEDKDRLSAFVTEGALHLVNK